MNEFDLIDEYFKNRGPKRPDVLLGIGDDAAVLSVPQGHELVVTTDTVVEGVHFPTELGAEDVGYRALAVNLSDLAAMGAEPAWATLALTIPAADPDWLGAFQRGLFTLADAYGVALIGGDTTRGPLTVTVQLAGYIPPGENAITRAGARRGDLLYVTGYCGDAAAGLQIMNSDRGLDDTDEQLIARFRRPEPRVQIGMALRGLASAAIDISDGLLADLEHLINASRLGAVVELERLPVSAALRTKFDRQATEMALSGGDDYELLFTVAADQRRTLLEAQETWGCSVSRIGEIVDGQNVTCVVDGEPYIPSNSGYVHFGETDQ